MIYVASLVARIRASANQTDASGAQLDRSYVLVAIFKKKLNLDASLHTLLQILAHRVVVWVEC